MKIRVIAFAQVCIAIPVDHNRLVMRLSVCI
jgi:hypothetical protein